MDLVPAFNNYPQEMIVTWSNDGGVFELIIDGILQSRVVNIATNGQITGQNRFIVGGSDVENMNYDGYMYNFNVWDKVSLYF